MSKYIFSYPTFWRCSERTEKECRLKISENNLSIKSGVKLCFCSYYMQKECPLTVDKRYEIIN